MPTIVDFPTTVKDAVDVFGDLFANEPARRHFAEYLTGLIVAEKKTGSGISGAFVVTTDQSCSLSPSRAGCPSPATRPGRARRRGPVACRLPTGLASRWQAAGPAGRMLVAFAAQGVHSQRDCGKIAFEIPIL